MKAGKAKSKKINYFVTAFVVLAIVAAIFFLQKSKISPQIYAENKKAELKETNYPKAPDFTGKQNETSEIIKEKDAKYEKAPDFKIIENWINSEPLKIEELKGKVVLVDFWTYTCINCIRTLPYLKEWDKKYRDKGLVIVGVHTPEFEFEKKYENVLKAVNEYQLKYPVAQDNAYATWSAYQNRYWPHKFLIDIDGYIRYDHIGEGAYEETEKMIQQLLNERMERLNKKNGVNKSITKTLEIPEFQKIGTPEIYFGYQFDRGNLGYDGLKPDAIADFKIPSNPYKNYVYLSGKWKYNTDNMELISDDGEIFLIFEAKKVNIVTGSDASSDAYIYLDNDKLNEKNKGDDVVLVGNSSIAKVKEFKLYNVVSAENYDTHVINMIVEGKGFKIYTFTFG